MDARTWETVLSPELTPRTTSTMALQTLSMSEERKINHLPQIERKAGQIDPDLLIRFLHVVNGRRPWPIFLTGPAGFGKTCAALVICDHAAGWYRSVRHFLTDIIDAQYGRLENDKGYKITLAGYWRRIREANFTVLDELGTSEKVSPHHYDWLCEFIEIRYNKPAIYISNLSLHKIQLVYDDRIASRLAAGTVIEVEGEDRRIKR